MGPLLLEQTLNDAASQGHPHRNPVRRAFGAFDPHNVTQDAIRSSLLSSFA